LGIYLDGFSARDEVDFLWTTQGNISEFIQGNQFRILRMNKNTILAQFKGGISAIPISKELIDGTNLFKD
jgi:hypothetical protein